MKDHSNETVRNVLELLRRIINFGVSQQLCPSLNWTIKLPKPDPDSERIEVLTDEQFQKLHEIWASYHDRHIAHLHQFIGWSSSRPSEVLKLLWVDVDLTQRFYIKRDTKSGKSLTFPMSAKLHSILQQQRKLLEVLQRSCEQAASSSQDPLEVKENYIPIFATSAVCVILQEFLKTTGRTIV